MSLKNQPACIQRPTLMGIAVEIRLRILRVLLVSSRRVICPLSTPFNPITLSRSAQILRANRQLYNEGTVILWEENTFWYTHSAAGSSETKIGLEPAVFGQRTGLIKSVETSLPLGPHLLKILKTHTNLTELTLLITAPGPLSLSKSWNQADFDTKLTPLILHLKLKTDCPGLYDELLELTESLKETRISLTAPGPARERKQVVNLVSCYPSQQC